MYDFHLQFYVIHLTNFISTELIINLFLKAIKMATEVLRGTLEGRRNEVEELHTQDRNVVQKKVFKIGGMDKHRIPTISKHSIHLPKYSRISF